MAYRPGVDLARLFSAALIVVFHTPGSPYKTLTLSGLSFFVLLTFCLQGLGEAATRPYSIRKRAARLLGPWLVWSLFYVTLRLARHLPLPTHFYDHPGDLLIGPEEPLWFLPFAFLAGIAAHALLRVVTRLSSTGALLTLSMLSAGMALAHPGFAGLPEPLGQWHYALPLLPIGVAVGLSQGLSGRRLAWHYLALLALTAFLARRCGEPSYLLGTIALMVAIVARTRDLKTLRWLASLSMGIYLIHPAVFYLLYKYAPGASWPQVSVIAVLASAAASAARSLAGLA